MTVYKRIVTIKVKDPYRPTKEIDIYRRQTPDYGIEAIPLQFARGIGQVTFKFVCSDQNPEHPNNMEHIDRLLSSLNIVREHKTHINDPIGRGKLNMDLQITANLDNPNIPDKLRSKAVGIHEEEMSEENVNAINFKFDQDNKKLSDTSEDNSDFKKPLPKQTKFHAGEIERG